MNNEYDKRQHDNHNCGCGCDDAQCEDCTDDIEVVELEDENGEVEEFVILEEVDFEDRHFAVMAPLAEVQAYSDGSCKDSGDAANDLSIEIFEVEDDDFTLLEDDDFAKRLLAHLDNISIKLEEDGK